MLGFRTLQVMSSMFLGSANMSRRRRRMNERAVSGDFRLYGDDVRFQIWSVDPIPCRAVLCCASALQWRGYLLDDFFGERC